MPITCNNTNEVQAAWYTHEAGGKLKGLVCHQYSRLEQSVLFQLEPSLLGVLGMDVDTVAEITAYITPTGIAGWQNKPTNRQCISRL